MTHDTIGIDISKAHLDAHAAPEGRTARFSNDAAGFRKLIAWIGPETARVAYEPSGPFHRDFEDALLKAGLPLYAINPYQVRCFARSRGHRAKTDAVDARTLATMADAIGDLAPVTRESGSWKGRSFIQGGRHHVRRLLYMPALVAIRYNPDLKRTYEALVANGKPPKVALTAVMRKLLVLANALIQQDRIWNRVRARTPCMERHAPNRRPRPNRSIRELSPDSATASRVHRYRLSAASPRPRSSRYPLDMDTPVHGRKLRIGIAAPVTVVQPQGSQRHTKALARTWDWRFRAHAPRCLMCTRGSTIHMRHPAGRLSSAALSFAFYCPPV